VVGAGGSLADSLFSSNGDNALALSLSLSRFLAEQAALLLIKLHASETLDFICGKSLAHRKIKVCCAAPHFWQMNSGRVQKLLVLGPLYKYFNSRKNR
jgi:hypothetical protein